MEVSKPQEKIKRWEWKWLIPWVGYKEGSKLEKEHREVLEVNYGAEIYKTRRWRISYSYLAVLMTLLAIEVAVVLPLLHILEYMGFNEWLIQLFN